MNSSELYLTDEKKRTYMSDFEKLLRLTNSNFWDIDNGIKETMIQINNYPAYQTLYSKKFEPHPDSWNLGGESYLEITAKLDSWTDLCNILQEIKSCVKCLNSITEINAYEPHDNNYLNVDSSIDIGCIKDPEHFRVKYFRIRHESSDLNCHDKFWECIATNFKVKA